MFILFCLFSGAQTYVPITDDASYASDVLQQITDQYHNDVSALTGPYKKYIAAIYKERYDYITAQFAQKTVVVNRTYSTYLISLLQKIAEANPGQPLKDVRILFSRSWWANASSLGENTILFNIGLFHRLENEAQAAFVICHELGHLLLNHNNNNIFQYAEMLYSDETQKELKAINKAGYRKNQQVEQLAKGLTFKNRRHSRLYEQAADSMAIELMKHTRYDLKEALSCLALLDSSDHYKYNKPINLAEVFNFPAFPFRKSWLQSDELSFIKEKNANTEAELDSLKTHPDCNKRIEKLKDRVEQYNGSDRKKFLIDEEKFIQYRNQFDYAILDYCKASDQLSRGLYFALKMLSSQPDNIFLHVYTGTCLNEFYRRQKAHELSKVTELPSPDYDEDYNDLLRLIQNLKLNDLSALAYYYLQAHQPANTPTAYKEALSISNQNFSK